MAQIMNDQKTIPTSSCSKHCKSINGKVVSHTPSIKCHEEVMSRLSSCTNEECYIGECTKQTCPHNHKAKFKRGNVKVVPSKNQINIYQSVSAPGSKLSGPENKDHYPKTPKSKSVSTIQLPNFNDSVDFIPVKLTTSNDRKQRPQTKVRQNLECRPRSGVKGRPSKPYRPTWDEILRNNLEVVNKEKRSPPKKSLQSNNVPKCCNSEDSSETLEGASKKPKQHSSKENNKPLEQSIVKQDVKKPSCESSESPQQDKLNVFQPINSSDPVKTLDFLIKQLRDGLLRQPESDSLQNIIMDMENAMMKISVDNKSSKSHQLNRVVSEKEDLDTQSDVFIDTHKKVRTKHIDIGELEQNLEKSCRYLQSLCIKQKESCNSHLQEKDQLSLQLAESRRLLAVSKSKEKNYEVTLGELRLKLQESNSKIDKIKQKLQDLENKNALLNEENKTLRSLKDSLKRVGVRLKQLASEKENMQSKLSLKDLEIEKLKVLLQMKTGLMDDGQQQNQNENLLDEHKLDLKLSDKDLSMISLSTVSSWSGEPGLMCSSQASSSPRHSPSPYNSWQHLSSIVGEPTLAAEIHQDIVRNLQELQREYQQLEPPALALRDPSSCSSVRSYKVAHSDGESHSFSS